MRRFGFTHFSTVCVKPAAICWVRVRVRVRVVTSKFILNLLTTWLIFCWPGLLSKLEARKTKKKKEAKT